MYSLREIRKKCGNDMNVMSPQNKINTVHYSLFPPQNIHTITTANQLYIAVTFDLPWMPSAAHTPSPFSVTLCLCHPKCPVCFWCAVSASQTSLVQIQLLCHSSVGKNTNNER